jgi:hypothetical protein
MAKPKVEQRSITVSTEYGHFHADRDAIYAAIGAEPEHYYAVKDGIKIECLHESKYSFGGEYRISGVRLWYRVDRDVVRKVNVKDGTLNLTQIDQKIAELVALKAADEERSRIQLADADAKREARQKVESEAEAAGLSFGYWNVTPRPIVSWSLQADLTLAVDKHQGLSIGQAIQVQQLIASFQEKS